MHSYRFSGSTSMRNQFGEFSNFGEPQVLIRENRYSTHPRRAASILAMSMFFIVIIASKARFASRPPAASASVSARGVICQERPQRSLHQPQALSWPPLPTIAFQ